MRKKIGKQPPLKLKSGKGINYTSIFEYMNSDTKPISKQKKSFAFWARLALGPAGPLGPSEWAQKGINRKMFNSIQFI